MTGIRCDANSIIASGHMMRCLTIARELVKLGEEVTFFVADDESRDLFDAYVGETSGISAVVMNTNWQDMEGELPVLLKELKDRGIKSLLVDSYKVTTGYFEKLKEICPVAYIDDLNESAYSVDMLINYSGYYESLDYEKSYKDARGFKGEPTKLLLGLDFAPLREQFYEAGEAQGHEGAAVLLTSGGADTKGMLLATLEGAQKEGLMDGDCSWNVVVGSLVKDYGAITEFAKNHPSVTIHRSVTDMAGLMRNCDVAICAAGTMLTECAAIRLPAIFYQVADNQKYNVEYWGKTGGMVFAGDASEEGASVAGNICRELKVLLQEKKLPAMKAALEGITDGRGAQRIARALLAEDTGR